MGAEVAGVCGADNVPPVRSLGAAHVIDDTHQDVTAGERRCDVIFDLVGNHPVGGLRRVLKENGRLVSSAGGAEDPWVGPMPQILAGMAGDLVSTQVFVALMAKSNPRPTPSAKTCATHGSPSRSKSAVRRSDASCPDPLGRGGVRGGLNRGARPIARPPARRGSAAGASPPRCADPTTRTTSRRRTPSTTRSSRGTSRPIFRVATLPLHLCGPHQAQQPARP